MTALESLASAAADGVFPAAAYAVGDALRVADGYLNCGPADLFDLASLTKVMVTTPVILSLVAQGRVTLDDPVSEYLSEWQGRDGAIRRLLSHTSGLAPYDFELAAAGLGRDATIAAVLAHPVQGREMAYSCLNFITLAALAERVTGLRLDELMRRFVPELEGATLGPVEAALPTSGEPSGVVHDPLARAMDGVSGNAGLFAPLSVVVRYARSWLPGGRLYEMGKAWTEREPGAGTRGLGWDTKSEEGSSAGSVMGPRSFGHLGYTGTALWIDPERAEFAILLTNAVLLSPEKLALRDFRPTFFDKAILEFRASA